MRKTKKHTSSNVFVILSIKLRKTIKVFLRREIKRIQKFVHHLKLCIKKRTEMEDMRKVKCIYAVCWIPVMLIKNELNKRVASRSCL